MLIKVGLELNFTFTSSVRNDGCHLKKWSFWNFFISNFEKIGQVFRNSTKKNQLFISDGSGVINLLMNPCNLGFFRKKDDIG
jgi:hypothetical protein